MAKSLQEKVTLCGTNYIVHSSGQIEGKKGILSVRPNSDGYASVTVGKKKQRTRMTVHRIVAKTFLPNPNNLPEVDHLDGDRMNPELSNLQWVDHTENIKRAQKKGSYNGRYVGADNPKAKLDEETVCRIRREFHSNGLKKGEISRKYDIPWSTVHNIVMGITWTHLPLNGEGESKSER